MNCRLDRFYLLHFADKESEGQEGEVTPEVRWCACLRARRKPGGEARCCQAFVLSHTAHSPHSMLLNISTI